MFTKKNEVVDGNYSDEYELKSRFQTPAKVSQSASSLEDARKNYKALSIGNIKNLRKQKNRAESLRYFDIIMSSQAVRAKELQKLKENGTKIIGTFCAQVPEELIYAAGAIPVRLACGFYDSIPCAEEIIPANTCPLVKSSIGFPFLKMENLFSLCDVIVIPTTCDAKKKMAETISGIKPVWTLEIPHNRDHLEARDLWQSQVRLFKKKLEKLTGKSISRKSLEIATRMLIERTKLTREFLEIKKSSQIVINGRDSLMVLQSAFSDDIRRWMKHVEILNKELNNNILLKNSVYPADTARIMITGSPMIWPTFKVLDAIEERAVVVIDDSCAGTQYLYNTVEVADWSIDSMIVSIADKYLLPTICPIFIHSDDRVDRIFELADQYKADGIIYHVLRLCQLMAFEFNKVNAAIKTKGIPMLKVETEYGQEDIGQISTRVEAFNEMIKARKEK